MRWKEPAAFTEVHQNLQGKWSIRPYLLSLVVLLIISILIWYIQTFILMQALLPFWGFCLVWVVVIVIVYLEANLERRMVTTVYIWSTGIGRYTGGSQWVPGFNQLKTFAIRDEEEYRILELVTVKDFTVLIGVPLEVDIAQLEGILTERGMMKRMA